MRPTEEAHDWFNMAIFEANKISRGSANDPIAAAGFEPASVKFSLMWGKYEVWLV